MIQNLINALKITIYETKYTKNTKTHFEKSNLGEKSKNQKNIKYFKNVSFYSIMYIVSIIHILYILYIRPSMQ